jgi:Skp family chaperone for outer membrane proteins
MITPKQHLHTATQRLACAIPQSPFDPRDAIIAAQNVAMLLEHKADRDAIHELVKLLQARSETLDRIRKAFAASMTDIRTAIEAMEASNKAEV